MQLYEAFKEENKVKVVLQVEASIQRLAIAAICPQGYCISGQFQWIGFIIKGQPKNTKNSKLTLGLQQLPDVLRRSEHHFISHFAYITSYTTIRNENEFDIIDKGEWVENKDGEIHIPPMLLGKGWIIIWILMDLTGVTKILNRKISDMNVIKYNYCSSISEKHKDLSDFSDGVINIETQIDYLSECWRSHSALLRIPLWNPFLTESGLTKLNNGDALITLILTSQLHVDTDLAGIDLELDSGYDGCNFFPNIIGPSFPLCLHPGESVSIAFHLKSTEGFNILNFILMEKLLN